MPWIDDFDGERPNIDDCSTTRLENILVETIRALEDPRDVTPKFIWRNQIAEIEEELDLRKGR